MPVKTLTAAQKKKYLKGRGNRCPWCEGENIDGDSISFDCDDPTQWVTCLDCGQRWMDVLGPLEVYAEGELNETK